MIYLASPYSSPIPEAQHHRFVSARNFVAHCFNEGVAVFSPVVYAHEMAGAVGLPTDANSWYNFNIAMQRQAEATFVLLLPGWKESKGVTAEIRIANLLRMPVAYFDHETFNAVVMNGQDNQHR